MRDGAMAKIAKVAISLPKNVLDAVEQQRIANGESRSQFFHRAVEVLLKREHQRMAIEQYLRGYQQIPETEDEIEAARHSANHILAVEPWE